LYSFLRELSYKGDARSLRIGDGKGDGDSFGSEEIVGTDEIFDLIEDCGEMIDLVDGEVAQDELFQGEVRVAIATDSNSNTREEFGPKTFDQGTNASMSGVSAFGLILD
jgi:hypothetical protein